MYNKPREIRYQGLDFEVPSEVYTPAEDTYLLADNLEVKEGEKVLELGTGCGLISILAAKMGGEVVSTDITSQALECARKNARSANVEESIDFRRGDLFEPVEGERFDFIVFNPPYLPVDPGNSQIQHLRELGRGAGMEEKLLIRFWIVLLLI